MLNIPDEQIFTLYEYENLKEELTLKDLLFNIIYDIKQHLGVVIKFDKLKEIMNIDVLNKYIEYLKDSLDPHNTNIIDVLNNTKDLFNMYKNKYINNIPNQMVNGHFHSTLLDEFISSLLEVEYIKNEYYSFN